MQSNLHSQNRSSKRNDYNGFSQNLDIAPQPGFSYRHANTAASQQITSYSTSPLLGQQPNSNQHEHGDQAVEQLDQSSSLAGNNGVDYIPATSSVAFPHFFRSTPFTPSQVVDGAYYPPAPPITPNTAASGQFDMLPPRPSTHSSWQALHEYAQTHASEHGYALSINTTAKNRARIKLACVCYGQPKNTHKLTPETRVRKNRASYKTGCKMWVEGKLEKGVWVLKVGESNHNHPGRAVEGWAVQRKRTWGLQGGRLGVGGVTAREEQERIHNGTANRQIGEAAVAQEQAEGSDPSTGNRKGIHSLENGGLIWKIVEQEMLRKGEPPQGRDRGVGRTVKVLEERLPGIHIFKRDVYNIRAQIRRIRKETGKQIDDAVAYSDNDHDADEDPHDSAQMLDAEDSPHQQDHDTAIEPSLQNPVYVEIDPTLMAQCSSALQSMPSRDLQHHQPQQPLQQQAQLPQIQRSEVEQLREEVAALKRALVQKNEEFKEKISENNTLRAQVQLASAALYGHDSGDYVHAQEHVETSV